MNITILHKDCNNTAYDISVLILSYNVIFSTERHCAQTKPGMSSASFPFPILLRRVCDAKVREFALFLKDTLIFF